MSNNKNKISISELESEIKQGSKMVIDGLDLIEATIKKALVLNNCKEDNTEWVYVANNITTALVRVFDTKFDVYQQKAHESKQLGMANYSKAGSVVYHGENERKYTVVADVMEAYANAVPTHINASGYRIDWKDLEESKDIGQINIDQYNQAREALGLTPVTLNK